MTEYKSCIICGKNSNGKPQCKECWSISQQYSDDLNDDYKIDTYDDEDIKKIFNKTLNDIRKTKNLEKRHFLCNELIGIGFAYPFDDYFQNKAYKEITKLNNDLTTLDENELTDENATNDYRKQNPANIYCQDGHYVRSKEERAIDDYLYKDARLLHAYEPKFSSRKNINFRYLTYNDSNILLEKLEDILEFYKQKIKH